MQTTELLTAERTISSLIKEFFNFVKTNPLLVICVFSAFALCCILIPAVIKFCKKFNIYDTTNERKVHKGNIPRLGSIGFVTSFTIFTVIFLVIEKNASLVKLLPFIVSGFLIFFFGILDDLLDLKAKFKLIIQIIAALIVVIFGYRIQNIGDFKFPVWISCIITFCWIIGIINAYNLIDGIDGLCGGLSIFTITTIGLIFCKQSLDVAAMCFILTAALLGFLIYNNPWPKAKIFMGDGGSQFLGFMIASLPLFESTDNFEYNKLLIMINLVAIPMFDVIAAIWRRLRDHKSIMSPDKLHLHHKLMNLGLDSRQVLLVLLLVQIVLCAISLIALYNKGLKGFIILVNSFVVLIVLFSIIHFANYHYLRKKEQKVQAKIN